jgi:hypothetical protein
VVPASETATGYPELRVIMKNAGMTAISPEPYRGPALLT